MTKTPRIIHSTEETPKTEQEIKKEAIISKKFLLIPLFIFLFSSFYYFNNVTQQKNKDLLMTKIIPESVKKLINNQNAAITIENLSETNGVYQFDLIIGGANNGSQKYVSYVTKDGKIIFTSGIKVDELAKQKETKGAQNKQAETTTVTKKSNTPEVELFVMSYCPFGTQIEKGILPVLSTLKDKIKFSLKFVSYAMHGEKEVDENLKQYCIAKNEPQKLNDYLKCFLKEADSAGCSATTGLNTQLLQSCVQTTEGQFKIKEKFNDKNTWSNGQFPPFDVHKADNAKYKVAGSPTLVINGTTVSAQRDSASLLGTICSAFTNKPKECSTQLSSQTPSSGFGEGTQTANSNPASCQ